MSNFLTPAAIQQAMQTEDQKFRGVLRAAFRRSLYVTCKFGICWGEPENLMDADTFLDSCNWLQNVVVKWKRGLFEDPRGHIKTTRATRCIPKWYGIQRPNEEHDLPEEIDRALGFLEKYPHMKGPDGRVVIGSDSKENAAKWVGSCKAEWEGNPVFRWAFPELVWANTNRLPYGQWSKTGYVLPGRKHTAMPDDYLRAVGLESKAQGGRAEIVLIDDLVGETSYRSSMELDRRKDWIKTIGFLLENRDPGHHNGGVILIIGNRWALDDVNSMIHNDFPGYHIWHRSGYRCMVHGAGNCGRQAENVERDCAPSNETLWKGRYPDADSLERVREDLGGDAQFAAQILNDPTAAAELEASQFRTFFLQPMTVGKGSDSYRAWCAVVPQVDEDGKPIVDTDAEIIPLHTLTGHCVSIDPASSTEAKNARTAVSWCAYDRPTGRGFWIACNAGHWGPDEAPKRAVELYHDVYTKLGNEMPKVLLEDVAAQVYFWNAMRDAATRHEYNIKLPGDMIPIKRTGGLNKDERIRRRVGNRLNQGLIYLCAGIQLPKHEARHFPTGTKDALDTWAQAEEVFLEMVGASLGQNKRLKARKRKRRIRIRTADSTGVAI